MNLEAAKAELAADVVKALAVALRQLPFGALLQTADGNDDEAHTKRFPAKWKPVCRRKRVKSITRALARMQLACAQPIRIGLQP